MYDYLPNKDYYYYTHSLTKDNNCCFLYLNLEITEVMNKNSSKIQSIQRNQRTFIRQDKHVDKTFKQLCNHNCT